MKTPILFTLLTSIALTATEPARQQKTQKAAPTAQDIPNPQIDYAEFLRIAAETQAIRETRRLTEEKFAAMAAEKGVIILDARSADKYAMRHIKGAVSLPFTDFTVESLAKVIPTPDTKVLIYCNNNFAGDPAAFAGKAKPAALNVSTWVSLRTYGYTNVYELGPFLGVSTTKLEFEGTAAQGEVQNR